jgi:hypothetical protein
VYRRTGGQRDSSLEVTNSVQRGVASQVIFLNGTQFNVPLPGSRRYSAKVRLDSPAFLNETRPSSCRLRNLDVMAIQQIAGRVVQLRNGNLKTDLRLDEIQLCLGELRLRVENKEDWLGS